MNDKLGISLGEAATWRGFVLLLTVAGIRLEPEQAEAIATAGASIYALFLVFFKRNPNSLPK